MESAIVVQPDSVIIDELVSHYLGWQEACVEVELAYEHWRRAEREDRALAHTAYTAALDREECAAACYRARSQRAAALC